MRNGSIAVLREIGVETGGSNVQWGDQPGRWPNGGDRNEPARVAVFGAGLEGHGFPIAKVAAKLAVATRSTNSSTISRV